MTFPAESLLSRRERRVSLLDLEPPDGTAPPDDEELAEPEEEESDVDDD
jgi:hypothetical protein